MTSLELSVVIPVFNSAKVLRDVVNEIHEVLTKSGYLFEIILINDCSDDNSWFEIQDLVKCYPECTGKNLITRQGQHRAVLVGLHFAIARYVVIMDDDGQNPAIEILRLHAKALEGNDLVFGNYIVMQQSLFRKIASSTMKRFVRYIFSSPPNVNVSNFKIINERVVRLIVRLSKRTPYINGEALLYSSNPTSILVSHRSSLLARSRYSLRSLLQLFKNVLFTYSLRPLRFLISVTLSACVLGVVSSAFVVFSQMLNDNRVRGWTTLSLGVSVFATFLFFAIGLFAEYVIRILESSSDHSVLDFVE
jgi:glycosyltransferase involved in cell wall biosynthesis